MFPIYDDNPHFLTPRVTVAVIAANLAAWLLVQGLGRDPMLVQSVCELGLIPGELLGGASVLGREEGGVVFWAHVGGFAAVL